MFSLIIFAAQRSVIITASGCWSDFLDYVLRVRKKEKKEEEQEQEQDDYDELFESYSL